MPDDEKAEPGHDQLFSTTPLEKEISGLLTPPRTTEQRLSDNKSASQKALLLLIRHLHCKLPQEDISLNLPLAEYQKLERLIQERPLLEAHVNQKVR